MMTVEFQRVDGMGPIVVFVAHIIAVEPCFGSSPECDVFIGTRKCRVKGGLSDVMALIHGAAKQKEQA